jgi:ABC-type sugar transport system permease subunit/ABC-type glycerol-3-phosphate transport system substrate-binding protein
MGSRNSGRPGRVACVALLFALAACSPGPPERRLLVWGETIGPNDKGTADVVREFERRHPGVKVRMLGMGAGGMNPQKLMTAIVGGVPPDVVYQDRFTLADWASRGAFQPLDGRIARDRGRDPLTPTPEQYYPATWAEVEWQGRPYGVPWRADTRALYWNRAVFRERAPELRRAGLDPDRPPQTWSELLAYSKVLTEFNPDGTLKRAGFVPNFGNSWLYLYAFQNEASFLSPDGARCTLAAPEVVEALRFMKECYDVLGGVERAERFQSGFRGEQNDAFFVGQVAMKIDGDWTITGVARFAPRLDFGVAPAPVPDQRLAGTGRDAVSHAPDPGHERVLLASEPAGAKEPDLAWEFVKFATSEEGRLLRLRGGAEVNRLKGLPTVPDLTAHVSTNRATLAEFLPKSGGVADAVRAHEKLLPVARIRPVTPVGQALWDAHVRATDQALRGLKTPEQALTDAQADVQSLLDERAGAASAPLADLRLPAAVGLLGLLVGVALYAAQWRASGLGRLGRAEARAGLWLVAPWIAGFLVFTLGPMAASLVLSATQYDVLSAPRWVGAQNYSELLGPDRALLLKSLWNVLYLSGLGVPLGLLTALAVALLLNLRLRGQGLYRLGFYLPALVPGVAGVILWMFLLNPDPAKGLVNAAWAATVGSWFGLPPPAWFAAEEWAKPALVLMGLFGAGTGYVVWLAGLKGLPNELGEAAALDGAGPGRRLWSVTLPQLSPLVFYSVVTGLIGGLQTFDSVYIVSRGGAPGPNDALAAPVFLLFVEGFHYFRMGYASALAWVLFLVVLAGTAVQFWLGRRWVWSEAGP